MGRVRSFGLTVLLSMVLVALGWRWASRRHNMPCPSQLSWMLDDRLLGPLRFTHTELDRIGPRPGQRVLEIGPGPGRLLVPAADRVLPGGEVVGLELQPGMIEKLQARAHKTGVRNLSVVQGDAADAHFPSETFDLVFMVTVLGEIPDRAAALSRAYEVLKPGGVLSVTEIFSDPHYQSKSTVQRLAEAQGFHLVGIYGRWYHYTANFSK
ncbi:MAG: class I SAM-dependent methyltransferase [Bacteroidetes bacterium]|nr:class I SAM-dependent methyltransferase [Bacteroidota bacterium]